MSQQLKNTNSSDKNQAARTLDPSPDSSGRVLRERSDLPCLYSNNSIENVESSPQDRHKLEQIQALCGILTPYHQKSAHILYANVSRLIELAQSVNHVGFLTLTFPDNVKDPKEAYQRFRSFNSNYLAPSPEYGEWISVKERQFRGAWHYHLLIQTIKDIRSGINFEQIAAGSYLSANASLKQLWKELRTTLPKYGLGRSELLPIRKNEEAMARYLGKYISKHIGKRTEQDKGVRLVNYSRNWSKNSVRFSWNTDNSKEWRRKLALFARYVGCTEQYQLSDQLGPGWARRYIQEIWDIDEILEKHPAEKTPEYKNATLENIERNQQTRAAEKQKAKDEERFLQWEKDQRYKKGKHNRKIEAENTVLEAKKEWKRIWKDTPINIEPPF